MALCDCCVWVIETDNASHNSIGTSHRQLLLQIISIHFFFTAIMSSLLGLKIQWILMDTLNQPIRFGGTRLHLLLQVGPSRQAFSLGAYLQVFKKLPARTVPQFVVPSVLLCCHSCGLSKWWLLLFALFLFLRVSPSLMKE
jgi:hypothetical protein